MGKKARARARRQDRGGQPALAWGLGDPAELFDKLDGDVDAHVRLLRADDAAAEPLRSLPGARPAEMLVALVEPIRNGLVQHHNGTYDIRIAIATKMGLPLAGPIGLRPAAGWTFGPRHGQWELADPTGTLIARCKVATWDAASEPAWTAQAMAAGQTLIAYGTRVGVRIPEGEQANRYDDRYRAAELRKSLATRQASAAIVTLPKQISAFRPARSG